MRNKLIVKTLLAIIFLFIYKCGYIIFNKKILFQDPHGIGDGIFIQKNWQELLDIYAMNGNYSELYTLLRANGFKSIVLHYPNPREYSEKLGVGLNYYQKCPGAKKCFGFKPVNQTDWSVLEQSDGVVDYIFYSKAMVPKESYRRRPEQLWVFYTNFESQIRTFRIENQIFDYNNWYNLTSTTKNKSAYFGFDLKRLHMYQKYRDHFQKQLFLTNKGTIPPKKKLALWFVSSCKTRSKRENFVRNLSNFMDIDIFGQGMCDLKNYGPDPCNSERNCVKTIFQSYKFYLAFENSRCDYYITEKYYQIYSPSWVFDVNIVPVVLGPRVEFYLKVAPDNHSFIFADAFPSAKALADYLLYLDANQTAYDEYFAWKRRLIDNLSRIETEWPLDDAPLLNEIPRPYPHCELCAKLHDEDVLRAKSHTPIIVSDIHNPYLDCQISPFETKRKKKFFS